MCDFFKSEMMEDKSIHAVRDGGNGGGGIHETDPIPGKRAERRALAGLGGEVGETLVGDDECRAGKSARER